MKVISYGLFISTINNKITALVHYGASLPFKGNVNHETIY